MNLDNLNLVELNAQEVKEVDGGDWGITLTVIGMVGAAMAWSFEQGQEMGEALAKKYKH